MKRFLIVLCACLLCSSMCAMDNTWVELNKTPEPAGGSTPTSESEVGPGPLVPRARAATIDRLNRDLEIKSTCIRTLEEQKTRLERDNKAKVAVIKDLSDQVQERQSELEEALKKIKKSEAKAREQAAELEKLRGESEASEELVTKTSRTQSKSVCGFMTIVVIPAAAVIAGMWAQRQLGC